jgi:hypothetical protein
MKRVTLTDTKNNLSALIDQVPPERLGDLFVKVFGPTRGVDMDLPPREPHESLDLK